MTMTTSNEAMLTTSDNPWNPFTQFDDWLNYDNSQGYGTLSYLARIVKTSYGLSQPDQMLAITSAIDEIVALNILGKYVKVTQPLNVSSS